MAVNTDDRGRIYLSKDLRERKGERSHIVEYEDRVELIPVDEDPLHGLRAAVGDALEGQSIEKLRQVASDEARRQAMDGADVR